MSNESKKDAPPKDEKPDKTQLGIRITVDRVEPRTLPSLRRDHADTVDFYVLVVEWNQSRYPDLAKDTIDPVQDDLRDVTVKYEVAKRFSVLKAFHEKNFKVYEEFHPLFPSTFNVCACTGDALRDYRKEHLGIYLNALVEATLQPNVLAEFATFIELHNPQMCQLTRMSKFKNELKMAADGITPLLNDKMDTRSNSVNFYTDPNVQTALRGYAIDDVVRIIKDGSSFFGREATVTDPNWHGLVKVEVTGLIGLKAGAKTYKLAELELISRPNDTGAVMVQEKDVVLGVGVLLLPILRRHLEYSGAINDKGLATTNKVIRLLDENKKLRLELENLNVITRNDVKEGKVERLKTASLAAAKESDRLRAERNALMKELDESKKKNDDMNRRLFEVDGVLAQATQNMDNSKKQPKRGSIFSSTNSKKNKQPSEANLAATARAILASSQFQRGGGGGPAVNGRQDSERSLSSGGSLSIDYGSVGSLNGNGNESSAPPSLRQSDLIKANPSNDGANLDVTLQEAIDTINGRESAASVLNGLKKLINLTLNSRDHALKFSQMGGIAGLAALIEEYEINPSIQEKALKLLVNLSFVSEEASREMVKHGTVKRVVSSLLAHPKIIGVQVKGLWSLKNLAHHHEGAVAVKDAGGIDLATKSIKHMITDGPIVDQGLGILQNIAHHIGPEPISLAWNASGISFTELKRIHASRTHTVDIASYLEQDIFAAH